MTGGQGKEEAVMWPERGTKVRKAGKAKTDAPLHPDTEESCDSFEHGLM